MVHVCTAVSSLVPLCAAAAAGKRPGSGSSAAVDSAAGNKKPSSKQPKQRGGNTFYDNAPTEQGSALQPMITNSITQISDDSPTDRQELEEIVGEWGGSFNYIQVSAAFSKAAKLRSLRAAESRPLLNQLAVMWDSLLPNAEPRQLANVLWACGKLRYMNPQLWTSTLARYVQLLQNSKQDIPSQELSSALHGMANVALANRGVVPGMAAPAVEAEVREIVKLVCKCATHPFLEGVSPQAISNTLWACAKLRINPGGAALDTLVRGMARPDMREAAEPQALANTLWAASELQRRCGWQPAVKQQVWLQLLGEQQRLKIADRGTPIDVFDAALAVMRLSTAGAADAAGLVISQEFAQQCVLQLLQGKVAQQLQLWDAQAIANSMYACAQLRICDARFLNDAAAFAHKWLPRAVALEVDQVAYACKVLQYGNQQLMAAVLQHSKRLLQQHVRPHESLLRCRLAAQVGCAVAALDMQQLAGDVRELVASSGVARQRDAAASHDSDAGVLHASNVNAGLLGMLWDTHPWLLQHQLLDGQGLAGLLSQQQLEAGRAAAAVFHAQTQQL
uniref:FAST kinase leucine-rich domain-containing protein n=1 Tax=Tetradesmus obliquus TaxID=3088 RepID=A0A383V400_TETOB|eukprot:jgi/Sobl393_1/1328/SZX59801.1